MNKYYFQVPKDSAALNILSLIKLEPKKNHSEFEFP